jgi:hypothetical protein
MRKFVVGLALSAFVMPAMAADLAPPVYTPSYAPHIVPVFSWTGCYIGADIDGAMSDQMSRTPHRQSRSGWRWRDIHANNFIGGGYAGCNYQWSSAWVIGSGDYTGVARTRWNHVAAAPSPGGSVGSRGLILSLVATVRSRVSCLVPGCCSLPPAVAHGAARAIVRLTYFPSAAHSVSHLV